MKKIFSLMLVLLIAVLVSGCVNQEKDPNQNTKEQLYQENSKEDKIKEALYRNFPNWEEKGIENLEIIKEELDCAYGTYNRTSKKKQEWFARKFEEDYVIIYPSFNTGRTCQIFERNDFLEDMTPDCWDEKEMKYVYTKNPELFFGENFNNNDREEIIQSFLEYKNTEEDLKNYYNGELTLEVTLIQGDYLKGSIIQNGFENHSVPYVLATKVNNSWKFIFRGQDYPNCSVIDGYDFPKEMVEACFYEGNGKLGLKCFREDGKCP